MRSTGLIRLAVTGGLLVLATADLRRRRAPGTGTGEAAGSRWAS